MIRQESDSLTRPQKVWGASLRIGSFEIIGIVVVVLVEVGVRRRARPPIRRVHACTVFLFGTRKPEDDDCSLPASVS